MTAISLAAALLAGCGRAPESRRAERAEVRPAPAFATSGSSQDLATAVTPPAIAPAAPSAASASPPLADRPPGGAPSPQNDPQTLKAWDDRQPPLPPSRSVLEGMPGYHRPFDPESTSLRTGRREVRPVAGEFQGGAASLEDLGRALLAELNARNEAGLQALRVTRTEFERILWPEFPQSRPITGITAEDALSLSEPRSRSGAMRALGAYGGRRLRLQRVDFAVKQPFTNFDLYRDVALVVVDEVTGDGLRLEFAPSVAARHGRFKAMIFRD